MKKAALIPFFMFCFVQLFSQSGIVFDGSSESWAAVLEKARSRNKLIFVDVFATWCGPCKVMDKTVFRDPEIGAFYNDNFINVKIDADKGYGPDFVIDHSVAGYPTYLYFSPQGELLAKEVGAKEQSQFLSIGKSAVLNKSSGAGLKQMEEKIATGDYDSAFLRSYIEELGKKGRISGDIFERYLNLLSPDNLFSDSTYEFIRNHYFGEMRTTSKAFEVLLNAFQKYPVRSMELMRPWYVINGILFQNLNYYVQKKDTLGIEDVVLGFKRIAFDSSSFKMDRERVFCEYRAGIKDSAEFIKALQLYVKNNITDADNGSWQKQEFGRYQDALRLKFGIVNPVQILSKDQRFWKGYICRYRLVIDQLMSIYYAASQNFKIDTQFKEYMRRAMEHAIENYKTFSPNFNQILLQFYMIK